MTTFTDAALLAVAQGDLGHDEVIATVEPGPPLKGAGTPERPWVVSTERPKSLEEHIVSSRRASPRWNSRERA
jgi:hypothetical protein